MLRSKAFRILLVVILLGGIAAIVWSYRSRSGDRTEEPGGSLLSADVTRRSTDFEYSQLQEGRTQFRVVAESSTLTREGTHRLEGVQLFRYGPENQPTDAIRSDVAIYQPEARRIEFERDVLIELTDGTRVSAQWAGGDLEAQVVTIQDRFEFRRGEVRGEGEGLEYRIEERKLDIHRSFEAWVPMEEGVVTARSRQVEYWISEGRATLAGGVTVYDDLYRLASERLEVLMDEGRNVTLLTAIEEARLEISGEKRFRGARMVLRPAGRHYSLEVYSGGEGNRAVYEEVGPGGGSSLEAGTIVTGFSAGADSVDSSSLVVSALEAREEVVFRSPFQGIEEGSSETFLASFDSGGSEFKQVELAGSVRLIRSSGRGEGLQKETIEAERLRIDFRGGREIEAVRAEGRVEILVESSLGERELTAERLVDMRYRDGLMEWVDARGAARLREAVEGERRVITAPTIVAGFSEGQLVGLEAFEGVELVFGGAAGERFSRSRKLDVEYDGGKLVKALQTGDVRVWRESPQGRVELTSDRAEYRVAQKEIRFTEGRPLLTSRSGDSATAVQESETRASEFLLDEGSGRLQAAGKVQSAVVLEQGPAVISAGRMETTLDGNWIEYREEPKLIQGENLLSAEMIRINPESESLSAEGQVRNILVDEKESETKQYQITSNQMEFESQRQKAVYSGEAVLRSEGLTVKAPLLEIFFEASSQDRLNRVEASGGVEIEENGRKWKADRATYFSDLNRVVVSSN